MIASRFAFRRPTTPLARAAAGLPLALCLSLGLGLSACSSPSEEGAAESTTSETSTETSTEETTTTETSTEETTTTETSTETSTETTTTGATTTPTTPAGWMNYVRETFASLAPESLFDAFDSCEPSGLPDTIACSGSKVGQFQFSQGASKALQTMQTLTQLRSSHVVEDDGSRVVGWSTVGNASIITVVDTEKGLIAQQLISTDKTDPEDRIAELGLSAKAQRSSESTSESTN